jgi:hypothetical protein
MNVMGGLSTTALIPIGTPFTIFVTSSSFLSLSTS